MIGSAIRPEALVTVDGQLMTVYDRSCFVIRHCWGPPSWAGRGLSGH